MMDTVRDFSEYIRTHIQEYLPETYQEADILVLCQEKVQVKSELFL